MSLRTPSQKRAQPKETGLSIMPSQFHIQTSGRLRLRTVHTLYIIINSEKSELQTQRKSPNKGNNNSQQERHCTVNVIHNLTDARRGKRKFSPNAIILNRTSRGKQQLIAALSQKKQKITDSDREYNVSNTSVTLN